MDEVDLIICRVGRIRSGSGHVESSRVGFVFFVCNFQIGLGFSSFGSKFLAHASPITWSGQVFDRVAHDLV